MVLRVDPEEKQAYLLSFPRDLYLPISGTGDTARINTAHAHGVQTLIDTIQDNFNIPIHHYVEIDFVGFEKLVDAVGGVPLWFDAPVRDRHTGLDVPQAECVGAQRRAGAEVRALALPRVPRRGRRLATATPPPTSAASPASRCSCAVRSPRPSSEGLSNPITLNELVSAGVANVSLDEHLDAGDLLGIGEAFAEYDSDDLMGYSIPSEPMKTSAGAQVRAAAHATRRRRCSTSSAGCRRAPSAPRAIDVARAQRHRRHGPGGRRRGRARRPSASTSSTSTPTPPRTSTRTTVRYGDYGEPARPAGGRPHHRRCRARAATTTSVSARWSWSPAATSRPSTTSRRPRAPPTTSAPRRPPPRRPPRARRRPARRPPPPRCPTTTTTVIGYSTGEPPDGVDCG